MDRNGKQKTASKRNHLVKWEKVMFTVCLKMAREACLNKPTILDKSPWDSTAIFIFFCYFSVPSLNSAAFSKFSCSSPSPHPIQSWNSEKNSGYTRPALFVGWEEGLDLCELENAPKMQKCPKTFVHDCSLLINQTGSLSVNESFKHWAIQLINQPCIQIVSQSVIQTKSTFHQSVNHSNS